MADARSKRKREDERLDLDGKKHRSAREDEAKERRRNDHGHGDERYERQRNDERRDPDGRRKPSKEENLDGEASHRRGHHERHHRSEIEGGVIREKEEGTKDERRDERKDEKRLSRVEKEGRENRDDQRIQEKVRSVDDSEHKRPKEEPEEAQPKKRRWDAGIDDGVPAVKAEVEKASNGVKTLKYVKTEEITTPASAVPVSANAAAIAVPAQGKAGMSTGGLGEGTHGLPSTSTKPQLGSGNAQVPAAPKAQLSLDALAKAKRALQMQKELNEKLKKLPQLGKPVAAPPPVTPAAAPMRPPLAAPAQVRPAAAILPGVLPVVPMVAAQGGLGYFPGLAPGVAPNLEAIQRAQEMAARLGFQPAPGSSSQLFGTSVAAEDLTTLAPKPPMGKPPVLRLDALGREIDEHGNVVERAKAPVSTLKVNLNKAKREAFKILHPELEEDPEDNPFFDPRMSIDKKKLVRPRRASFQFVEEGKWTRMAEVQRLKAKFGEERAAQLKARQAAFAKAKADAEVNPNLVEVGERVKEEKKPKDPIPDVEWWDARLLNNGSYEDVEEDKLEIKEDLITIYVEHPVLIEPPAEAPPPPPQPLKLTKKEQKKLRTQRRLAREKERQEMVRQGLLEPPKPKVKMSNLMKVLGAEAVQDPTKLEREVRDAAAEREQAHVDRNLARKLTPAEKREKKERKLFDDPNTLENIVAVYRVNDLSHPQLRFKVDVNAQENRLTGCVVMSDTMSVVIVEGGSKSIKRYSKLMLRRIDWNTKVEGKDDQEEGPRKQNKCILAWQGSVARPSFDKFTIQQCRAAVACRKFLSDAGVGHYWDLAANFPDD